MKSKIIITVLLSFLSAVSLASPDANAPAKCEKMTDVEKIVQKADLAAYYQGDDGRANVTMTITDKKGNQRNREFVIFRKDVTDGGDQKYYVYFEKPADVRRMVYMVHKHTAAGTEDDRWLYLPSLDLVRRIAASDKRTSFVGSDFLYEDVSGRGISEDTHELVKTTDTDYVVKNTPKKPDSVEFSYYLVTINIRTCMPMKMEYYDKSGKLYRVITSLEVKPIQCYYTVLKSEASDLNTGSKTIMEFSNVKYNTKFEDIFTERYLRRPPREVRR